MELPFAVNEESSNFPPSSSNSNSNNNNNNNNNNARNSSNSSLLPTTTASPNSYQNVNVNVNNNNMNMIGNSHSYPVPVQVPVGVNANANGSTNPTRSSSTSSSLSSAGGNLLHRVALYDNVHTEHFYTPRQLSSTSSLTSTGSNTNTGSRRLTPIHDNTATANNNHHNHNNRSNNNNSMAESTFVTIDVDHNNNYNNVNYNNNTTHNNNNNRYNNNNNNSHNNIHVNNNNHQMLHYNEYSTIQSSNQQNYTNTGTGGLGDQSFVSVGLNSYKQKQQELQQLQKLQQQGQGQHQQHQLSSSPKQEKFDILSLLISSCSDPPHHHQQQHHHHESPLSENENKTDDVHDITNDLSSSTTITPSSTNTNTTTKTTNFVQLCEEASKAASKASKLTHDGDITNAAIQHQNSAKLYKDAAIYLKKNHGVELALLAYSLLVLSNSQSRTCEALLKNGGISGVGSMGGTVENGKGTGKGTNKNYMVSTGNVNDQKSKGSGALMTEQRLRDKIRASMNKAEVDMSESTFLSKDSSTTISNGNGTSDPHSNGNALSHKLTNTVQGSQQHIANNEVIISAGGNTVNPVDDMMELEKELRDMDMTLEMGVGLGNNNNNGGGSFCVVPGGSSYMASSMMWSSGIGGRAQQPPSQQQHPLHGTNTIVPQHNAKTRMNRVQTMLDASSATLNKPAAPGISQYHNTIIAPAPKQTPSSLEASWWGQASALASSTTSLSNSMVGVRSPNSLTPHQMNGMDNASAAPANTRQLMKLLDSLKTLGDENASLLREVEEAQKARLEAKAAREAMKQFQHEYGKRFESLRLALEKFRNDYPERHGDNAKSGGGSNNQNVVAKSDFVKTNMMMENKKAKIEIQKKDQMIKMLTADLKKEKAESKKKDDKLRKFENFYRDVKARSAQKAKQREEEQRRKNQINRKG